MRLNVDRILAARQRGDRTGGDADIAARSRVANEDAFASRRTARARDVDRCRAVAIIEDVRCISGPADKSSRARHQYIAGPAGAANEAEPARRAGHYVVGHDSHPIVTGRLDALGEGSGYRPVTKNTHIASAAIVRNDTRRPRHITSDHANRARTCGARLLRDDRGVAGRGHIARENRGIATARLRKNTVAGRRIHRANRRHRSRSGPEILGIDPEPGIDPPIGGDVNIARASGREDRADDPGVARRDVTVRHNRHIAGQRLRLNVDPVPAAGQRGDIVGDHRDVGAGRNVADNDTLPGRRSDIAREGDVDRPDPAGLRCIEAVAGAIVDNVAARIDDRTARSCDGQGCRPVRGGGIARIDADRTIVGDGDPAGAGVGNREAVSAYRFARIDVQDDRRGCRALIGAVIGGVGGKACVGGAGRAALNGDGANGATCPGLLRGEQADAGQGDEAHGRSQRHPARLRE